MLERGRLSRPASTWRPDRDRPLDRRQARQARALGPDPRRRLSGALAQVRRVASAASIATASSRSPPAGRPSPGGAGRPCPPRPRAGRPRRSPGPWPGCARAPCSRSSRCAGRSPPAGPRPRSAAARLRGIVVGVGGDGRHHHLHRREPQREGAGVVLDQHAEEPLHRAEDRPVQHHRPVLLAVLADVGGVQPLGQHDSPAAACRTARCGRWRPSGGTPAWARRRRLRRAARSTATPAARAARSSFASAMSHTSSEPTRRSGRSASLTECSSTPEVGVDRVQQLDEVARLRLDLVLAAEDVGVVLGQAGARATGRAGAPEPS